MKLSRSFSLLSLFLSAGAAQAQLAKGATKFLGNITTNGAIRSDFLSMWNQISPENEGKWGTVQGGGQNSWNWSGMDALQKFSKANNIPYKFHCLVWGSQQPSFMTNGSLNQTQQLAAITAWFDAAAARYPDVELIDVVNEAATGHAPAPYKNALGGDGATGYDWIVTAFKMARARWPHAILIYNDYNIIEYSNDINWAKTNLPKIIKAGAPIDAIGCQSHGMSGMTGAQVKANIDALAAATGKPIYSTEFDIDLADDTQQKNKYADLIPAMWTDPNVAGITVWGYIFGSTWETNSGLIKNGSDRAAMTWLRSYIPGNKNPPAPQVGPTTAIEARAAITPAHPGLMVKNVAGHLVMGIEKDGQFIRVGALGRME